MVAPDLRRRGIGRWLLGHAESVAPPTAVTASLLSRGAEPHLDRLYRRTGYRPAGEAAPGIRRWVKLMR
jgi:tRNA (guanine37-N1)-methyltransferase